MESSTVERKTERPPAIDANTVCEAFQITAEAMADQVALRTKDDEVSLTWGEYADHVAQGRRRAGRARRGPRATPWRSCSPTGPSSTTATPARCTSAPRRSRSTTPTRPSRSSTWWATPANTVVITEQAFLDRIMAAKDADNALEHVVVVDGDAPEGAMSLDRAGGQGRRRLRLRGRLEGRRARRHPHADLHLGHHRAAQGRADHAREHDRLRALLRQDHRLPVRRADRLLPPDGPRGRAQREPVPADAVRLQRHRLSRRPPGGPVPARGASRPGSSPCRASGRR